MNYKAEQANGTAGTVANDHPDSPFRKENRKTPAFFRPTLLSEVGKKVLSFHQKMNRINAILMAQVPEQPDLVFDPAEILLQFYIDKAGLDRLVNISNQDGFDRLGVFFGLEDKNTQLPLGTTSVGFGRPTGCFVGLDINDNVLPCHIPDEVTGLPAVSAEDTWPPKPPPPIHPTTCLALKSDVAMITDMFKIPIPL